MLRLELVRHLHLARSPSRGRAAHLAAASGLVRAGRHVYVVADDEHHLGVFDAGTRRPGTLHRIRVGTLPDGTKARKRAKPDFEAIVALPAFSGCPFGALFVLGSGSRPNRRSGVLLPLAADGRLRGSPRRIELGPWFALLTREFGQPNVEGAFVDGPYLSLLQRGNKSSANDARVRMRLAPTLDALARGRAPGAATFGSVTRYRLPEVNGVPLCLTDGAALPGGGFAFTAVAEDTRDAVADGECAGSAIGLVGADDRVRALWRLDPPLKVEGIAVTSHTASLELMVCTDADDPDHPGRLLRVVLGPAALRAVYRG